MYFRLLMEDTGCGERLSRVGGVYESGYGGIPVALLCFDMEGLP